MIQPLHEQYAECSEFTFLYGIVQEKVIKAPDDRALEGAVAYCVGFLAALKLIARIDRRILDVWEAFVGEAEGVARQRLVLEETA